MASSTELSTESKGSGVGSITELTAFEDSEGCAEFDTAATASVEVVESLVEVVATEPRSGVPSRVAGGVNPRPSCFDHGHIDMFARPMVVSDDVECRIGLEGVLEKRRFFEDEVCDSCWWSVEASTVYQFGDGCLSSALQSRRYWANTS